MAQGGLIDPSNGNGDTARWLPEISWDINPMDKTGVRMENDDPPLKLAKYWLAGGAISF
jgi:hypothetical protein